MNAIRDCALNMERCDTHGHLGVQFEELDATVAACAGLDSANQIAVSRSLAAGCRSLYGVDPGPFLTADASPEIFKCARELRKKGAKAALEYALGKARIKHQLVFSGQLGFQDHRPSNHPFQNFSSRLRVLAYIDPLITGDDWAFTPQGKNPGFCWHKSVCGHLGDLRTLADYLHALDTEINQWRGFGVVGMKLGLAYTTGLFFSDPTREQAEQAFARREAMSFADVRLVQDFAVRHVLLACQRNRFPVVIHTGWLAWGQGDLRQSNPMLLHNLIADSRYRDITFVLLHGGTPAYTGETTYLAGAFPNVYLDMTWISWFTRTRFRQALAEWLEAVPLNRFCIGSDSGTLENIVGIDTMIREELAVTLEDCVTRRILDEKHALAFLENTYTHTPQKLFSLE